MNHGAETPTRQLGIASGTPGQAFGRNFFGLLRSHATGQSVMDHVVETLTRQAASLAPHGRSRLAGSAEQAPGPGSRGDPDLTPQD